MPSGTAVDKALIIQKKGQIRLESILKLYSNVTQRDNLRMLWSSFTEIFTTFQTDRNISTDKSRMDDLKDLLLRYHLV